MWSEQKRTYREGVAPPQNASAWSIHIKAMTLAESEYRQSIFGLLGLNYDELHLNGQLGNNRIPLDTSNVQNHND